MNSEDNGTEPVLVFKTGKLYELDMVANALEEKHIPFFRQEESSGGVRFAMPFQPSMGPGTGFCIFVPRKAVDDAMEILSGMPFETSTNPSVWDFGARSAARRYWRIYAWVLLVMFGLFLIVQLYRALSH